MRKDSKVYTFPDFTQFMERIGYTISNISGREYGGEIRFLSKRQATRININDESQVRATKNAFRLREGTTPLSYSTLITK